ncbi:MAG TPA: alpha/beta hydrolase domain-containing protein, partial [Caulobacteraceae bacterium]|nr:alpha/beta hydrolase domain-containing protein [Caulobacteraceae bacterium]
MRIACGVFGGVAVIALLASQAEAKVVKVDVQSRTPMAGSFGSAGAYELITGRFFGELDPKDPKNAIITDLSRAPRNARGVVEYSATFQIAKPVDMAKASGFLFYNVPNRGNGRANADPEGHVRVVSGWQGDIPPTANLQTATVPLAKGVTGPVEVRFVDMPAGSKSLAIRGGLGAGVALSHPLSMDSAKAQLIKRPSDDQPGTPIPASDFAFADCSATPFPGKPDPSKLCVKGGFDPAYAYELRYIAKDPPVLGIGFAATRDLNEFLRYSAGTPAAPNPVAGKVKWTIAVGVSQSGNYLRSFTNLGFNQGEGGKQVFDAINPQIAGRHVPLNVRFAVPGGASGMYEPGSEGVLWWSKYDDRARHLPAASLLDRCTASHTCPKVFEIFGSTEFWGLRMSPNLVGTDADRDIPLPANVRRYYFPSVTHGGGRGGWEVLPRNAPGSGPCVLPANPNPTSEQLRALQRALEEW